MTRGITTLILAVALLPVTVGAQILSVTPAFPSQNDTVTIIYDATEGNGALTGVVPVYAHAGLITNQSTSPTDWRHVQGNWGTADASVLMTNLGIIYTRSNTICRLFTVLGAALLYSKWLLYSAMRAGVS